jgi:hypothetical protein
MAALDTRPTTLTLAGDPYRRNIVLLRNLIVYSLAVVILGACSDATPTVGEAKSFPTACDKVNDGKRVAVAGYLRFPSSFTGNQSVVLRLYETPDFKGKPIGVQIDIGTKANQVDPVPKQYSDKDLMVHVANDQVAVYGAKVNVSGKVYYPLVDQEFDCALENPLVELAK